MAFMGREEGNAPRWVTVWVGVVVGFPLPPPLSLWTPGWVRDGILVNEERGGEQLAISMFYQILDLVCSPSRSTGTDQQQKQQWWGEILTRHFPAPFVFVVDTFGFLGFLALLIANAIVVSDLWRVKQIYIYNSIPWLICWYVSFLLLLLLSIPSRTSHFANASREKHTLPIDVLLNLTLALITGPLRCKQSRVFFPIHPADSGIIAA